MKIALICPSNLLYMPYVRNYKTILEENNIDYDIINWDRFGIEEASEFTYRDSKVGHQRNFLDYYKYHKFLRKHLRTGKYDKIIVFGIQLSFFLKGVLKRKFKKKYILDIRDYNKILRIFNPKNIIDSSFFVTISSPAYKEWLPISDNYIVNHNTNIRRIDKLKTPSLYSKEKFTISYIGSLANFEENADLIESLKNSEKFLLEFHGKGIINDKLEDYISENSISNTSIYGVYDIEDEERLYLDSDLINMVLYNKNINDRTCLSNRLYNSAIYARPMVAMSGIYLSEVISLYNLGLVVNSYDNIEEKLLEYLSKFNINSYNKGRAMFLKHVLNENEIFEKTLIKFINY